MKSNGMSEDFHPGDIDSSQEIKHRHTPRRMKFHVPTRGADRTDNAAGDSRRVVYTGSAVCVSGDVACDAGAVYRRDYGRAGQVVLI